MWLFVFAIFTYTIVQGSSLCMGINIVLRSLWHFSRVPTWLLSCILTHTFEVFRPTFILFWTIPKFSFRLQYYPLGISFSCSFSNTCPYIELLNFDQRIYCPGPDCRFPYNGIGVFKSRHRSVLCRIYGRGSNSHRKRLFFWGPLNRFFKSLSSTQPITEVECKVAQST